MNKPLFFFLALIILSGLVHADSDDKKTIGNSEAEVKIIIYTDFQDSYSALWFTNSFPQIKKNYLDTGKANIRFRHFPLEMYKNSFNASLAAECAAEQEEFLDYISILYKNQKALSPSDLENYAGQVGLDSTKFKECLLEEETKEEVNEDIKEGKDKKVTGTPTFFIKDIVIYGAQDYLIFESAINNALEEDEEMESCTEEGYQCYDIACPGMEQIPSLSCPSMKGTNRPSVCCKEIIDLAREPKILLNKKEYRDGDFFQVKAQSKYNSDCSFYLINPEGVEKEESRGTCSSNSGFSVGDIGMRLKQLFGSAEIGTYKVKYVSNRAGYEPIIITKDFDFLGSRIVHSSECTIKNGTGTCEFLNVSYGVVHNGCGGAGSSLDLAFTYDGKVENFTSLEEGKDLKLANDIRVKVGGAPCSIYQIVLVFKQEKNEDSKERKKIDGRKDLDNSNDDELICNGCNVENKCYPFGYRQNATFCSAENSSFISQISAGAQCNNNFECSSNVCAASKCVSPGLIDKIIGWFKGIFGSE